MIVKSSSSDVINGIVNSEWFDAERDIKKQLFLVILRSQRSQAITMYKFSKINLSGYTEVERTLDVKVFIRLVDKNIFQILTASYTYFTILKTISSE